MRLAALLPLGLVLTSLACAAPRSTAAPPRPRPLAAAPKPPPPPPSPDPAAVDAEVTARLKAGVTFGEPWKPSVFGAQYLAPDGVVADDGSVDVMVHFHGAGVVEKQWRASGLDAVVVGVTYPGYGVAVYRDAFADPARFGAILDDVLAKVGATRVRRLGCTSWSAGYGGTTRVLEDPRWYPKVDAVVLLDGLHVDYSEGLIDDTRIRVFERFARDAMSGSKQMVVTHSSIAPYRYASTTETASFLLASLGVARVEQTRTVGGALEWYHADQGDLHVRGYRGAGPRDHMDQVALVDDVIRELVAPRWARMAVADEWKAKAR